MIYDSFEDLDAWKLSRELKIEISELVKSFPKEEDYKLKDQLIRCTRSITANIAEGYGRFHFNDNIKFCIQARGSLIETLDHLITANDEKYIDNEKLIYFRQKIKINEKVLNGYISYLRKRKSDE